MVKRKLFGVVDRFVERTREQALDVGERLVHVVEERIIRLERKLYLYFVAYVLFSIGVLACLISLFYFLIDYLQWNRSLSFLVLGVGIIVIGIIVMLRVKGGYHGTNKKN